MIRTKLRLGLFFICGIAIVSLIILYQLSLLRGKVEDDSDISENRLPFSWVSSSSKEAEEDSEESSASSSPRPPRHLTCRHTIQGSLLIADDQGVLCLRKNMLQSGCCERNVTGSTLYACSHCNLDMGCCSAYEACVSCCMSPDKRAFLMSVLNEARSLSNILILSVSDQYELCLAKCRTSSRSVHHENTYKNPEYKFCYKKIPSLKETKL
uniref:SREBP regulating gene protein n=1 Tax=Caligus rogercresseyi TaxID=217165 RepID=C1BR83_CALRO|nr:UPF0454 protein C12orf49 homolog precursor [Caligus rogercresseyi]